MAAFGAARCQATVGRELEDDDEAVTVVPGDAEEAPAPTTLVLLMASHIASADRLCALGDALRAASAAQTAAPDGILLSWSAEEAWRESARQLVKECDCDAVECSGRRSQFEHLAALGALVAHRWGKKRSERVGEPYEYFHYAVRVPALLSFLGAAPPALKAARFCDVAFVEFLRRTDRVVFSPRSGAFKTCWLYFYGGCDGPRASRSVPWTPRRGPSRRRVDAARRLSCGALSWTRSRYAAHFRSRLEFFAARMVGGAPRRADAFLQLAPDVVGDLARLGLHKCPHLFLWCASRALHGLLEFARDFGVRLRPDAAALLDAADTVADLTDRRPHAGERHARGGGARRRGAPAQRRRRAAGRRARRAMARRARRTPSGLVARG
ncbi:hypothetical protein JL721_6303 [Aureococcus anophagefferens]|nr:hypothetical protein JL721_6303 [Aureococcus anophagefferens]